jgi:hypothetical protein
MFLGGTQDNSDLRLTTGGTNGWYQAITGDGGCCNINPSDPDLVYVTKQYLYVWGSSNGGATYSPRISGLGDGNNKSLALFVAPVEMDKNAPFVLYAGGTSVWESRDGAHTWHSFFAPRPGNPKCSAISVGPALVGPESADLWFGYEDGQLVSSANRGASWWNRNPTGGPLPDGRFVTDIEVSPHDRNVVLVSFGGYEPDGVWLTTNGGGSWTDATGDAAPYELPSVQVNCVSFHPSHPDWIYAGTDIGLFASEDRGHTWNVTSRYGDSEGPVFTEVDDIIWHSDSRLIAVTHGRGMYECTPLEVVFVDAAASGYEDGTWNDPWNTVGEGLNAIGPGATLSVRGGAYSAGPQVVTRRITLTSNNGTAVIQ